ncbi:MAG: hypothetical protein H8E20_07700 [Verrucomicrobia bacterium]|nr:hypothetical protein [Verrucomicrobiota bacterium]
MDANKDGKLSLNEIEAAVKALKTLDKNKDGELTLVEFGPSPVADKLEPRSISKPSGPTPRVATKPNSRPSGRPSGRPGSKATALSGRKLSASKPSAKSTRPGARPRPSAKPGRRVAKTGAPDTTAKSSGPATGRAKTKRVARKSPAPRKSKSASRRRPASKPITPPANAGSPVDAELKALIGETKAVTGQIKQAVAKMKNPANKQSALKWVRKESRELLRTLDKGLKGTDADNKAEQVEEAKQKLAEARKLLE